MLNYKEVLELKNRIRHLKFKGIKWEKVISVNLWVLESLSLKKIIKKIIKILLFDNYLVKSVENKSSKVLIEFSKNEFENSRKDYLKIDSNLKKIIKEYGELEIDSKLKVNVFAFLRLFKLINLMFLLKEIKLDYRVQIIEKIITLSQIIPEIEKELKRIDPKLLINFCDAHMKSNFLSQIARNLGIKTATLQHGQYYYYESGNENVNMEVYSSFISDYILVWGEVSKKELEKAGIDSDKIVKCGSLKDYDKELELELKEKRNIFGVVLDNNVYIDSNKNMLNIANIIAEKYELKYYVKAHPANNEQDYEENLGAGFLGFIEKNKSLEEYKELIDFSILHLTSLYIELMRLGSLNFVYKDKYSNEVIGNEEDSFFNDKELFPKLESFYKGKINLKDSIRKNYKNYIEENAEEKYRMFIETIV